MFLASLVGDIIRGMCFLHDSVFHFHGRLKSSNCLIDSRWVLKVADFGLRDFRDKGDDVQQFLNQVNSLQNNILYETKSNILGF